MIITGKLLEVLLIVTGLFATVKFITFLEEKYQTGWFALIIATLFGLIYFVM